MALLRQIPATVHPGGVQTYMDDMNRMREVLSSSPQHFSWWTVALLLLLALGWFAALASVWIYLKRRFHRSPDDAIPPPPRSGLSDPALSLCRTNEWSRRATTQALSRVAVAGAGRVNSRRKRLSAALSPS